MNELALFTGAGGGILGGKLLGWRTVCAVECDAYPAQVLAQRQNDGILEPFPIWSDVRSFDGKPWRGIVDVVSGGFPCQDISAAGKGAGIDGERSGLWGEMARIICEVRPRFAFVENSPMLTSRGLGRVLGDLAQMGYNAKWCVLGADDVGAPHRRKRIWIVATDASSRRLQSPNKPGAIKEAYNQIVSHGSPWIVADAEPTRLEGLRSNSRESEISEPWNRCSWWDQDPAEVRDTASKGFSDGSGREVGKSKPDSKFKRSARNECKRKTQPLVGRVADGVACRVDRLKAIGNGQVPAVAATAWRILTKPKK